jgi:hypothetical protein
MRKDHQPDASESLPPESAHELVQTLTDEVRVQLHFQDFAACYFLCSLLLPFFVL